MAEKLSIRYRPERRPKTTTLSDQVQQVISQRGAFRHISEQSLKSEADRPVSDAINDDQADLSDAEASDHDQPLAQPEMLWKKKADLLQQLSHAQNEILSALDFVSLLLSNHAPGAMSTMSPTLKELVPPKTIDGRVIDYTPPTASCRQQLKAVSDGWKTESFHQVSTKLGSALSRLERQTDWQGQYWEQIAYLQSQGWSISRLPSDSRAIGVHFSSQESAPQFRNRGFALLQQDDDGKLNLDSRLSSTKINKLHVSIVRNGVHSGYHDYTTSRERTDLGIESQLIMARDSLFDEELFYEISREARLIANQKVRQHPQVVEADVGGEYRIRLSRGTTNSDVNHTGTEDDNKLAQTIAYCFRFLLLAEHDRLHKQRTQSPPSMTIEQPIKSEFAILRPILAQLRHQSNKESLLAFCNSFSPTFRSADLPLTIQCTADHRADPSPKKDSFGSLHSPMRSSIILKHKDKATITIRLETFLGSPSYGTAFVISAIDLGFLELKEQQFGTLDELQASIMNLLELTLVAHVDRHRLKNWTLTKPHSGEFIVERNGRNFAKVMLCIQSNKIVLHSMQVIPDKGPKFAKRAFRWNHNSVESVRDGVTDQATSKTFDEALVELDNSFNS